MLTGASRGIGRAIAERLAGDGAAVVINNGSNGVEAQKVVAAITAKGGQAHAVKADIGRVPEIVRLFDETIAHFAGSTFWSTMRASCS